MRARPGAIARRLVSVGLLLAAARSAAAQQADPALSQARQPAGWSVTPRVTTSLAWDDNVLIQGAGDTLASDLYTIITPGASLDFLGRRGAFSASYNGAAQRYRDFGALNNYSQSINVSARRRLSSHTVVFAQQSYSRMPTTELPALAGIPFLRLGARIADVRAGIEGSLSKRLSMTGSYNFQWIAFDKDPVRGISLLGGYANGGAAAARYQLSAHTTLTADYSLQRANISTGGEFNVQNTWAGADVKLDEYSRVYGAFGVARLDAADLGTGRTSPAWRAGYSRQFEAAAVDASYARSFVPSYGGGGTLANEELTGSVRLPLGRRTYTQGTLSWRRNEPLSDFNQPLTSIWAGGVAGYAVRPWLRVEGFFGRTQQNIDRPGGRLNRNQFGIQVITATPLRIR